MSDLPASYGAKRDGSARDVFEITPSDDDNLPTPADWIRIGSEGEITVLAVGSSVPCPIPNVKVGEVIYAQIIKVFETGTTPGLSMTGYKL